MKFLAVLAAQAPSALPDLTPAARKLPSDLTLIFLLMTGVVVVLLFWVIFIRGPKKHPEERDRKPLGVTAIPSVTVTEDGRERHRKKKRVRRRDHRDRNPTLAQTGGLPPPRDPQESTSI